MLVEPIVMEPLEPGVVVKFKLPPAMVPVVVMEPPGAESLTARVPEPTLEVWTVVEAVSETEVVPEIAVALMNGEFVLVIVAPPVPVLSERALVSSLVPGA
jgi:hypothetical protein